MLRRLLRELGECPITITPWEAVRETLKRSGKDLYGALATVKHEAFSAEREWRFISPPIQLSDEQVKFRPAQSTLIPFVDFELCDGEQLNMPIKKILLGPTPHREHSRAVVGSLINRYTLTELTELQECGIPFRQI